ncbi:hypothetical protein FACS189451_00940 [Bacteroidia bacterium]|nr:hypothetical protein FACS189446_2900 [Bacteroidia bacterium]GHT60598.1 hypothetical protein FACS189451_00940 [Bacteroidia bacterium]
MGLHAGRINVNSIKMKYVIGLFACLFFEMNVMAQEKVLTMEDKSFGEIPFRPFFQFEYAAQYRLD